MTEIFIEPELANLQEAEVAAEWFEICTELGLQHQLQHASKSEEKKAPPYMPIDPKTERIIRALCPRVVKVSDYSASTIPVDILKEIKKAQDNGWYDEIKIAYDDKSPDPFVIGFTRAQYKTDRHKHLIARWGAELIPFELLESKAIERLKDEAKQSLLELKYKVQLAVDDIEGFVKSLLSGRETPKSDFKVEDLTW